jgi:hypothetical protein
LPSEPSIRALYKEANSPAQFIGRALWCLAAALYYTLDTLSIKLLHGHRLCRRKRGKAEIVIKSWCFGPESLRAADDFYFGSLPQLLQKRGLRVLVLCGDLRGRISPSFAGAVLTKHDVPSIPEMALPPLWAPFAVMWDQFCVARELRRRMAETDEPKLAAVCAQASIEAIRPSTLRNALQFFIAKSAVQTWRPKAFLTLYEGQPWESSARQGAKGANPNCVTVGYQHTVVMPHSLLVTRPPLVTEDKTTPDMVLCLGEVTQEMMRPGHGPLKTQLVPFGSFRRNGHLSLHQSPRPGRRKVLVLPEGIFQEAVLLFDVALASARLLPEYGFIFRCHPVLPFETVAPYLRAQIKDYPNVELSKSNSLNDDFLRASVLLYRGSSTVLYGIASGLKPIYVHHDKTPDVDPLFELGVWRESVSSVSALAETLRRYEAEQGEGEWKKALEYIDRYTMQADATSVDRFLTALDG